MRKTPELQDDVAMNGCVSRSFRIAEGLVQFHAVVLIGQELRMHERQIEKGAHRCVGFLVEAPSKGSVSDGSSERISRERAGAAAEHVPGKLVK